MWTDDRVCTHRGQYCPVSSFPSMMGQTPFCKLESARESTAMEPLFTQHGVTESRHSPVSTWRFRKLYVGDGARHSETTNLALEKRPLTFPTSSWDYHHKKSSLFHQFYVVLREDLIL